MIWLFWIVLTTVLLFAFVVFFGAPYVPSKKRDLAKAFDELYSLGSKDLLVDIGSGDGIVLRLATRKGARAVGYEINPILVMLSKFLCRSQSLIDIRLKNFWLAKFPDETTIVYVFGESRDIKKMATKVQNESNRLEKKILLMSYGFQVPNLELIKRNNTHFLYEIKPNSI